MEEKIFEFIKLKTPNLLKVLDFKLKNNDDENGSIYEYYEVRCLLVVPDTSILNNNMLGRIEKTCLVNVSEFKNWLKGEDSIKWL